MSAYTRAKSARKEHQHKCKNALIQSFLDKCFHNTAKNDYDNIQFAFARDSSSGLYKWNGAPRTNDNEYCNGNFTESDLNDVVSNMQSEGYSASLMKSGIINVDLTQEYKEPLILPQGNDLPTRWSYRWGVSWGAGNIHIAVKSTTK